MTSNKVGMTETPAQFLQKRDAWIRMLVGDLEMSHATTRVGVHLVMRMTAKNRTAWPATKTIAKETGVSVRTVIRAIDQLEAEGYLHCTRKRNVGNRYSFRFP